MLVKSTDKSFQTLVDLMDGHHLQSWSNGDKLFKPLLYLCFIRLILLHNLILENLKAFYWHFLSRIDEINKSKKQLYIALPGGSKWHIAVKYFSAVCL